MFIFEKGLFKLCREQKIICKIYSLVVSKLSIMCQDKVHKLDYSYKYGYMG